MDLPGNYRSVDAPMEPPQPILQKPIPIFLVQTPMKSSIMLPMQYSDLCFSGENETNKQENIQPAPHKRSTICNSSQEQKCKIQKLKYREASQIASVEKKHIFQEMKKTIEKLRSENCLLSKENSDLKYLKDTCYFLQQTNNNLQLTSNDLHKTNNNLQQQNKTLMMKNLKLEARLELSANLRQTELKSPSPPAMTSPSPPAITFPELMTPSSFPNTMIKTASYNYLTPSKPAKSAKGGCEGDLGPKVPTEEMLVGDGFQISAEEAMHLATATNEMMDQLGCLPRESWNEPLLPGSLDTLRDKQLRGMEK